MLDRRRSPRIAVDLLFNKYLGGHPYLARALDVSQDGLCCRGFVEPAGTEDSFPIEIGAADSSDRIWIWARRTARRGELSVLQFIGIDADDRRRLAAIVAAT